MAARSFWKGYLKLSLVTCPVAMMPATSENEKVRFHTVNRKTSNRVVSRYVDAVSGKPVDEDDEAKGYEAESDRFVILEDDELEAVALESTRTIDIDKFVPRDSIAWIYLDSPYYLTPDDPVGEDAFSVIRDAMAATNMVGISRVVMNRRERAVMLEPRDKGIIAWTLRYGEEVRDPGAYFANIDRAKPDSDLLELAKALVADRTKPWSPDMVKDPVQEHLLKLIASKRKRRLAHAKTKQGEPAPERGTVVSIMDALRQSMAADTASKSRKK